MAYLTDPQRRAIECSKFLKVAEAKHRQACGQHPAYPWSGWADRPRACAIWSPLEIEDALKSLAALQLKALGKLDEVQALCELAWLHGRSANGIREKLIALLGWKKYNASFSTRL